MTDAQLVRIARAIDRHLKQVELLCDEVQCAAEDGDERAAIFVERLNDNCIPVPSWATHIVMGALDETKWETRHAPYRNGIVRRVS